MRGCASGISIVAFSSRIDAGGAILTRRARKRAEDAKDEPKAGYQVHHIVEQTPARADGFPEEQIEAPENKVLIPTLKHRDIGAWFSTKNPLFDGHSPWDHLRDKDWDTRRKVGIDALIDFGVLKP